VIASLALAAPLPLVHIPLGTGNDLGRSFGWTDARGTFHPRMAKNPLRLLEATATAAAVPLDRWRCSRGAHGVLTGTHGGTHGVLMEYSWVLKGTHLVLIGY
jgi:hypothetical protein